MAIRPLSDRLVIKVIDDTEQTSGDIVLYAKYAGTDIKLDNEMLKILSVKDVLGVLEA